MATSGTSATTFMLHLSALDRQPLSTIDACCEWYKIVAGNTCSSIGSKASISFYYGVPASDEPVHLQWLPQAGCLKLSLFSEPYDN